jgi:hypothetical protein
MVRMVVNKTRVAEMVTMTTSVVRWAYLAPSKSNGIQGTIKITAVNEAPKAAARK